VGRSSAQSAAVIARAHVLQNRVEAGAITREEAIASVVHQVGGDASALWHAVSRCEAHHEEEPAIVLIREAAERIASGSN
jgi:hypothetical protein